LDRRINYKAPRYVTFSTLLLPHPSYAQIRGVADKSLAQPGRKQATATKRGIYSTHSPRSSIRFLLRCSKFRKPLKKKKFRKLSVQPDFRGSNDLRVGRKMANFQLFFFQSREQEVARRGQIRRIVWMIKTVEAQVGQFLLSCKCPVNRGIVVQEQDPFGDLPAAWAFSLHSVLHLHQQRSVILRVDSLALWKIINEEDANLITKNRGENFSSGFLYSVFFWAGVSRYAPSPLIVALSPGYSDIARFLTWSPIATGNHLDRAEKNPKVAHTNSTVDVYDARSGISRPTSRRASACPNLHE